MSSHVQSHPIITSSSMVQFFQKSKKLRHNLLNHASSIERSTFPSISRSYRIPKEMFITLERCTISHNLIDHPSDILFWSSKNANSQTTAIKKKMHSVRYDIQRLPFVTMCFLDEYHGDAVPTVQIINHL